MTIPKYTADCPEGALQMEFTVTDDQTDASGRMRPSDFARQMERITAEQMRLYGIGRDSLREEGKIWVLAWTEIAIARLPRAGERVFSRVWAGKGKFVMYPRKYAFYSAEGEPLAGASSLFILMDEKTRGAARPSEKLKQIPVVAIPGEAQNPPMRVPFPKTLSKTAVRTVQPEEIDQNGHLNNTRYLDWAMDLAKEILPSGKSLTSVWVEYTKELRLGQQAQLQYEVQEGSFYLKGFLEGSSSFSLRMEEACLCDSLLQK